MQKEIFKDVLGYEGSYQISNLGNIKSIKFNKDRMLKKHISNNGYEIITLHNKGKLKTHTIHRLLALAFIPNPQNKPQINHIDGVKTNNVITNLEWATVSENTKHAFDNNLCKNGENHYFAKLDNNSVIEIFKSKLNIKQLSEIYKVSVITIYKIKQKANWAHLTKDL
jgi:hypothetical protein